MVLPVFAFGVNEVMRISDVLRQIVGSRLPPAISALHSTELHRPLYPFILAAMLAFVLAERGHRSRWICAGLVLGTVLSSVFALAYVPVLHLAAVGILLLGLGLLGFSPMIAAASYGSALLRYLKGPPVEESPEDRARRLGPWA